MKRYGLLLGLAVLPLSPFGPASAANIWFTSPTLTYQCKGLHARINNPRIVIATHTAPGDSSYWGTCELRCRATAGCVAFNFSVTYDPRAGERKYTCQLLSSTNYGSDEVAEPATDMSVACYRGFPLDNYAVGEFPAIGRFQQDVYRPGNGFNNGQSPANRYKP